MFVPSQILGSKHSPYQLVWGERGEKMWEGDAEEKKIGEEMRATQGQTWKF